MVGRNKKVYLALMKKTIVKGMLARVCILFFFLGGTSNLFAQIGGETTYQFLELTNSARVAALGGTQVALNDPYDLNLPFHNPALLDSEMTNQVLANYVNYFADVNYGYASYSPSINLPGNFAFGMQYINYGSFKESLVDGSLTGNTFNAAEYAFNIIYSNSYKRIHYGINLKPVLSVFESYQSFGLAADMGVSLTSKSGLTTIGLVLRNVGSQITPYYDNGEIEPIPLDLQFGISGKLKHAPVIISATMQHLNNWKLAKIKEENNEGEESFYEPQENFIKQAARHLVLGVELLPSENFTIRAGYNYQRRQELKLEEKASTVGFSMGFGVKIKRFKFDFATSRFHVAGSSNLFSIAYNISK